MTETTISIANDFSPFPSGRRRRDGPFSGEAFREDILKPAVKKNDVVVIDLDGVAGLPSSFWEEVFGGIIRKHLLAITDISKRLKLRTTEPELEVYCNLAYRYANDAADALANKD